VKYVSLHHHSTFSYGDGYGLPRQHVERAAELGMGALALTEHGNVSSHVPLEKACDAVGIKGIYGMEAYTGPIDMRETANKRKWHLTVLAQDENGYRNLNEMVTRSWADDFYQWPTVLSPNLAEHSDGLIILSGCADSFLACNLLGGKGIPEPVRPDVPAALRVISQFKELFGDRYYLEVQQFPELARTRTINSIYAELSRATGVPLVATSDVHYPHPDDNNMQVILHAASRGSGRFDDQAASWEYNIRLTHPTSDRQIHERLMRTGLSKREAAHAIMNTSVIADRTNLILPKVDRLRYPYPDGVSARRLIWEWLRAGWRYRIAKSEHMRAHKDEYVARLKYEMDLIELKDFIDYFLMLSDLVSRAKDAGIPVGPARGSAAASLVCWLLRITEVNPMLFPVMLFERFIDINRTDIPDVDLDFADDRRDEVRLMAIEKYGADHVGNIGTFTKYKGKNSIDDVARVFGVPQWETKIVKDLIVERSGGDSRVDSTLEDTVEMFPQAKRIFEQYPDMYHAYRLEGNYKAMSVHAAGLVISNDPINNTCATYTRESRGRKLSVLAVDKYDAEYLGLMKADFLGLTTMGMIMRCLALINMELDDPAVIKAFRDDDVVGIFQFWGGTTRIVNHDVAPETFMELADINALARPGPLHSGSTADYIKVKRGEMKPEHLHPIVDRLTTETKGQIIYQEQILSIIREVGGLPWAHIQEIRKIISLKKGEGAFNEKEAMFHEGSARLHGMSHETSLSIWRRLVTAGQYAFNAAHCVSYSTLAYWTMWFKVYHPVEFYVACLQKYDNKKTDQQFFLMRDAVRHGIEFLPPDLQRSQASWSVDDNKIRGGFEQVRGIAQKLAKQIMEARERDKDWADWDDMRPTYDREADKLPVLDDDGNHRRNKNDVLMWESPVLHGVRGFGEAKIEAIRDIAESEDPYNIYVVDRKLAEVRGMLMRGELGPLPKPTHQASEIPTDGVDFRCIWLGIPRMRNPQDVVEDERARSGEDLETIRKRMSRPDLVKKMAVECIDDSDRTVFLRFSRFKFPEFEKALWNMRLGKDMILVRGVKRGGFGTSVHVENMWVIEDDDPEPEEDDDGEEEADEI
jgi:DNA polymerase-3 subunit alpha